jgi:hypothetical protein
MADKSKDVKQDTMLKRLSEIEAERQELIQGIEGKFIQDIRDQLRELEQFGLHYKIVRGDRDRQQRTTRPLDPSKPCGVCGFVTEPPHDSRSHRFQGEEKKVFGVKELEQLKLKKV